MGEHLWAELRIGHEPMTMPKARAMIAFLRPLTDEAYARMLDHQVVFTTRRAST